MIEGELQRKGDLLAPRVLSTGTILYGAEGNFKTVINKYEDAVSAIMSLTARSIPTSDALDMMLWPMLSSSTSGIPATAFALT